MHTKYCVSRTWLPTELNFFQTLIKLAPEASAAPDSMSLPSSAYKRLMQIILQAAWLIIIAGAPINKVCCLSAACTQHLTQCVQHGRSPDMAMPSDTQSASSNAH